MVCAKFAHTKDYGRREGFTQKAETTLYNLDVIISVGYRVKSKRGTQFRIWANKILKQYLLQGYAVNERIAAQKYDELSQLVKVLGRTTQFSIPAERAAWASRARRARKEGMSRSGMPWRFTRLRRVGGWHPLFLGLTHGGLTRRRMVQ